MNLVGMHSVLLEAPNRLVIPEVFLDAMGWQLVLKAPVDGAHLLEIWAADGFEGQGGAIPVEADASGCIEVPATVGSQVSNSEFALCGNGDHLELWDASEWSRFCESMAGELDELFGEPDSGEPEPSQAPVDNPDDDSWLTDDLRAALERVRDQRLGRNTLGGMNTIARFDEAADPLEKLIDQEDMGEWRKLLDRALARFNESERVVLRYRFGLDGGEPHTLDETSATMGLAVEEIRRLELKLMSTARRIQRPCHRMSLESLLDD